MELRPIPGFAGCWISASGDVFTQRPAGRSGADSGPVRALTPWMHEQGYRAVSLSTSAGKKMNVKIHRLVLLAWVGPPPSAKSVTRHLDGNPLNNDLANLTWGTYQENADDKTKHGKTPFGSRHANSKLEEHSVVEILRLRREGISTQTIARAFDVSRSAIRKIIDGVAWKHVSREVQS